MNLNGTSVNLKVSENGRKLKSLHNGAIGTSRPNSFSETDKHDDNGNGVNTQMQTARSLGDLHRVNLTRVVQPRATCRKSVSQDALDAPVDKISNAPDGIRVVSNFLSKVKRQICKHALETSSDWPSLPLTILKENSYSAQRPAIAGGGTGTGTSTGTGGLNVQQRRKKSSTTILSQRYSTVSNGSSTSDRLAPDTRATSSAAEKRRILKDRLHALSIDGDGSAPCESKLKAKQQRPVRSSTTMCESVDESEDGNVPPYSLTLRTRKLSAMSNNAVDSETGTSGFLSALEPYRSVSDVQSSLIVITPHDDACSRPKRCSEQRSHQCLQPAENTANSSPLRSPAKQRKLRQSIRECEYDEQGLTWDIYGADFDPNELGEAIEMHLQKIIQLKHNRNFESPSNAGCSSGSHNENERDDALGASQNEKCEKRSRKKLCICI